MKQEKLHVRTPLIESTSLSLLNNAQVWLKMDAIQPAGSFKLRGIGHMCQQAKKVGCSLFISASGGNAGYAVAYSGRKLKIPVEVFVPSTTPDFMRKNIESQGAKVIVAGNVFDEAHQAAVQRSKSVPNSVYIPPFDHPDVWEGNSTLIDEIKEDLIEKPTAIICSVGGGGLLNGVVLGLEKNGWGDVPTIAIETEGAASFHESIKAGKLVTIKAITSVAKSLGALRVSEKSLELSKKYPVISSLVSDKMAIDACIKFADEHRVLVEPACGASLAVAYEKQIKELLQKLNIEVNSSSKIVIIVCGGQLVNQELFENWKNSKL